MSLQEFIAKYNLQGIDTDGAFGFQCMDLMHRYCMDVLGLDKSVLAAPSARDVWFDKVPGKENFEAIPNTPTNTPLPGDIIFWGTGIGPFGHVAIVQKANVNDFTSFDQNFPTGTKCHLVNHTYKGVLGWLRYKGGVEMDELNKVRLERDKNWNLYIQAKDENDRLRLERDSNWNSYQKALKENNPKYKLFWEEVKNKANSL